MTNTTEYIRQFLSVPRTWEIFTLFVGAVIGLGSSLVYCWFTKWLEKSRLIISIVETKLRPGSTNQVIEIYIGCSRGLAKDIHLWLCVDVNLRKYHMEQAGYLFTDSEGHKVYRALENVVIAKGCKHLVEKLDLLDDDTRRDKTITVTVAAANADTITETTTIRGKKLP